MATTTQGNARNPEYRTAQNNTGAALAINRVVKRVVAEAPDGVEYTAADTDVPAGVLAQELAASGGVGDMAIRGQVRVVASAAIAANARIAPAANGKVQTAIAGDIVIGIALEAAAADADIIMAEIDCVSPVLF